jgi:hypothetical protein
MFIIFRFFILYILTFSKTQSEVFSLIVIPDSQTLMAYSPENFLGQMNWVAEYSNQLNIAYVAHVGDIVEHHDDTTEWDSAHNGFLILEELNDENYPEGIPYGLVPGNHDYPTDNFNRYFGVDRFNEKNYYGGSLLSTKNDNNYTFFSNGGRDFIVINLDHWLDSEFPIETKINWSDSLMKVHKDKGAIIVSHNLIIPSFDNGGIPRFNSYGQDLFDNLKHNANFFMMLTGHRRGEELITKTHQGRVIHSMLANYQNGYNASGVGIGGTDGWLRLLEFNLNENYIDVNTYSAFLDSFRLDSSSMFTLPINFNLFVNNQQNDLFLIEDFEDTIKIDLDSIFCFIGGSLDYSISISDTSFFEANLVNHSLNIYSAQSNSNGISNIVLTAYDSFGNSVSDTFNITLSPINDPPSMPIIIEPFENDEFTFDPNSINTDGLFCSWIPSTDIENDSIVYDLKIFLINDALNHNQIFTIRTSDSSCNILTSSLIENINDSNIEIAFLKISLNATDNAGATSDDDSKVFSINFNELNLSNNIPNSFYLSQNYPNPFNPVTLINYNLEYSQVTNINIYDLMGKEIKILYNNLQSAGHHSVEWDATNKLGRRVSAGIYFYTFQIDKHSETKKMILLK